jgi:Methyltransferase FkbM domain
LYYEWNNTCKSFMEKSIDLPADAPSLRSDFLNGKAPAFALHSQAGQDFIVLNITKDKRNGYFVDLAANHWLLRSNTYSIETYNAWKGICIEANPTYLVGLLSNRRCKVFVNPPVTDISGRTIRFRAHKVGEHSGIVNEEYDNKALNGTSSEDEDYSLISTTLTQILDAVNAPLVMDYLSLDIEGAEYHAMKGLDLSKYTFNIMTIERPTEKLHTLICNRGYHFVRTLSDWGETLYLHEKIDNYDDVMKRYGVSTTPSWIYYNRTYLLTCRQKFHGSKESKHHVED